MTAPEEATRHTTQVIGSLVAAALLVAVTFVVVWAGTRRSTPAISRTQVTASGTEASIVDFDFSPPSVTVKAGTTVRWRNAGAARHTVSADDGSFASEVLSPTGTFEHTFAAAGTVAYHCDVHPRMKATVVVQ